MAESNEPEKLPIPEPDSESSESGTEIVDEEMPPEDPDVRTGFSAEQRRFLWTLVGVNAVAVLLGAAIIVLYMSTARSQDAAVIRLGDAYDRATEDLQRTEQRDVPRMIQAAITKDSDMYNIAGQEALDAYRKKLEALAQWRRARGLDASDPTTEDFEKFTALLQHRVSESVQQYHASTQPASRPDTQSATKP